MKQNPFPGMNPWLEWHWGDVHTRLATYGCDQLQPQLPPGLRARVEEYVAVEAEEEPDFDGDRFSPDVRVIERPEASSDSGAVGTAVATVVEPLVVPRKTEPETLRFIQIIDTKTGHRVITSIEFLSLANKTTEEGRRQYRAKQQQMLDGRVNLVEIDLLRSGAWVLAVQKTAAPRAYRQPYRISVVRADQQHVAEIYQTSLREPLPTIRIPLRTRDDDVSLNLQTLIDTTYVNGGYEDIDYSQDPRPPLIGDDAEWADQRLRERGLR
ncbi:MAG: DUF4058 family protein [Planctomycetes bacterium]|nr:DUF4058 family protein [Planctomycetota bacterium]